MANSPKRKTERQRWRMMQAPTAAAKIRREQADRTFDQLFPEGHQTSIGRYLQSFTNPHKRRETDPALQGFNQFHPEACKLLLEYGEDFIPHVFMEEVVAESLQPTPSACSSDTWKLMYWGNREDPAGPELRYVEGLAMGATTLPMLHAWLSAVDTHIAYDWNNYSTAQWTRYFGIGFTESEYRKITADKTGRAHVQLLFGRSNFPKFRRRIVEVLSGRSPKTEKPVA